MPALDKSSTSTVARSSSEISSQSRPRASTSASRTWAVRSHTGTPTSTGSGCSQWVENTAVADADKPSGSTAVNVTGNTTGLGGIGLMAAQSPRGSASKNKRCRSARTCTMLDSPDQSPPTVAE